MIHYVGPILHIEGDENDPDYACYDDETDDVCWWPSQRSYARPHRSPLRNYFTIGHMCLASIARDLILAKIAAGDIVPPWDVATTPRARPALVG